MQSAGRSDIGRRRSNNQDSFLMNEEMGLYLVADGMGGHSGGEVASLMAVQTLESILKEGKTEDRPKRLVEAIELCNRSIFDQAKKDAKLNGMGTTLTATLFLDDKLYIGQVGDSRCYLYRESEIYQLTEDHSQVYELLKAGLITDANFHSFQRNVITRSVGFEPQVNVDMFVRVVRPGDRYLVCSDGLSGMVSNEQMAQVLQNFTVAQACDNLIELANLQGGEDNISVVIVEI